MAKSRQSSEVYIMRPCRVSTCPIISLSRHTQCMSTCGVLITISADHRGPSFPPPLQTPSSPYAYLCTPPHVIPILRTTAAASSRRAVLLSAVPKPSPSLAAIRVKQADSPLPIAAWRAH